jgi:hypothetical protein
VIDATQILTSVSGGALLPVWTGTGFADDVDFVAITGRRLGLVPTTFLHQRDGHLLGDRATSARFEGVDLAIVR